MLYFLLDDDITKNFKPEWVADIFVGPWHLLHMSMPFSQVTCEPKEKMYAVSLASCVSHREYFIFYSDAPQSLLQCFANLEPASS